MTSEFNLGQVVVTKSISILMEEDDFFHGEVSKSLFRYRKADFSDMEHKEDIRMNNYAIMNGGDRIFATYNTSKGKIYIITEWDRSVTTILFPDEY